MVKRETASTRIKHTEKYIYRYITCYMYVTGANRTEKQKQITKVVIN